jgi:hypothetical protein
MYGPFLDDLDTLFSYYLPGDLKRFPEWTAKCVNRVLSG